MTYGDVVGRRQRLRLRSRPPQHALLLAPLRPTEQPGPWLARCLRVGVLARVLERLQHVRDDRLVRRDRQVLGVVRGVALRRLLRRRAACADSK